MISVQTRDEKIAMYMKLSKRELAEMLVNYNEILAIMADRKLQEAYPPYPPTDPHLGLGWMGPFGWRPLGWPDASEVPISPGVSRNPWNPDVI